MIFHFKSGCKGTKNFAARQIFRPNFLIFTCKNSLLDYLFMFFLTSPILVVANISSSSYAFAQLKELQTLDNLLLYERSSALSFYCNS